MTPPAPETIRAARVAAGLTQAQAGELLHITERAWQHYELGTREMPMSNWELFQLKTTKKRRQ